MIRKLLMAAAVAIVPISAVVATGTVAGAAANETGTATCRAVTGTISFSTPISLAGKSLAPGKTFTETSTVKATLTKCARAGGGITLTKGSVVGTVKQVTKNTSTKTIKVATCTGLEGTHKVTGRLTTTWTASKAINPSVSNFTNEKGGTATISGKSYWDLQSPGHVHRRQGGIRFLPRDELGQDGQVERSHRGNHDAACHRLQDVCEVGQAHDVESASGNLRLTRTPLLGSRHKDKGRG